MQQTHTAKITISADGKCLNPDASLRKLTENDQLDTIEITIEGSRLLGGKSTPSLLGKETEFLTQSKVYNLVAITTHHDGKCIASYKRSTLT